MGSTPVGVAAIGRLFNGFLQTQAQEQPTILALGRHVAPNPTFDNQLTSDNRSNEEERRVQVLVRDNNVDQALRVLKKKMQREGVFREMKLRSHYEKPSERKTREKAEAIRRARKLAGKKMQREGLLPMKPRVIPGAAPGRPGAAPARAPRRSF